MLSATITKHTQGRAIRRILDHGGDRGDLVSGLIAGADAFVYDISGINAAPRGDLDSGSIRMLA